MSKKQDVLVELYKLCQKRNNYIFDSSDIKKVATEKKFANHFDVVKIDRKQLLPEVLIKNDIAVIHIGYGKHKFIKGIKKIYHELEPIKRKINWNYKKSLLNQYNSSESNMLSVANNQRILHDFAFGKDLDFENLPIEKRPKTYFPHRTKITGQYFLDNEQINIESVQVEIDLTIEFEGRVAVFEAKNGSHNNFVIYQLYHPFFYYYSAKKDRSIESKIKDIFSIYVSREIVKGEDIISLWKYTFSKPDNISSIKFLDSASYKLIKDKEC